MVALTSSSITACLSNSSAAVGPTNLVRVAESGLLSITHTNKSTAVLTNDTGNARREARRNGLAESRAFHLTQSRITDAFRAAVGKSGRGRRLGDHFARHVNYWEPDDSVASTWTTELLSPEPGRAERFESCWRGSLLVIQCPTRITFDVMQVSDSEADGSPRLAVRDKFGSVELLSER